MVGRDLDEPLSRITCPHIGEELLRIEDWTVHHPLDRDRKVVDDANLNVRAGEIVGIAGLMGAGRTELAMSVFGRTLRRRHQRPGVQARQGDHRSTPSREAIDHGIAYATEDRKRYGLNLIDDIQRNISIAALDKLVQLAAASTSNEETAGRRTSTARA